MSTFAIGFDEGVAGVADDDAGDEEPLAPRFKEGFEVGGVVDVDLPFTLLFAGTVPKDLTPSDFTAGAEAGEEDMGAPVSSIDPKDTAEPFADASMEFQKRGYSGSRSPCFTAPTVLRGTLTPSFMGIPWPRALGLRECVALAGGVALPGAGDEERGLGTVDEVAVGGPFAQADFVESGVGIFCAEAVEDLLILSIDQR